MSFLSGLPYGVWLMAGGLLLVALPRSVRPAAFLLFPAVGLWSWWSGGFTPSIRIPYPTGELLLQRVDALAEPFVLVFTLTLLAGGLYAFHVQDTGEKTATLLYGGAAIGTVMAGDWVSFYIFWEIMAWSSLYLIWAARDEASGRAGQRYVLVHLFGGMLLLAGIWMHIQATGAMAVGPLTASSPASWLILGGFALNAAVPPLHAWLPDAYPQATVTGSVFLSAFTTKTAVYALLRVFPGWEVLIWAGVIMTLYGVTFAVIENDVRRLLAYHIVSQVGYMVAAAGLGTELAVNGATAHAFAHVLYKALLFMGAGTLIHAAGTGKLSELGGLARPLRWSLVLYMVGAVSISGFPLFSGFVSKSMVVSAFGAGGLTLAALALQWASVGTYLSTTLKLPYFAWGGDERPLQLRPVPAGMYAGMTAAALLSVLIGLFPQIFYQVLPHAVPYQPYTAAHLAETLQLLGLATFPFVLLLPKLAPKALLALDTDWFYRVLTPWLQRRVVASFSRGVDRSDLAVDRVINGFVALGENPRVGNHMTDLQASVTAVLLAFVVLLAWALLGA